MGSTGIRTAGDRRTLREGRFHVVAAGARLVLLLLGLVLGWSQGARGQERATPPERDAPAPASDTTPRGYLIETRGPIRWTYPHAAKSEVDALRAVQRKLWPQLGTQLGAYLEPTLDIRVAINPDDMQLLAPGGRVLPSYASGVAFPAEGIVLLTLTAPDSWVRPDMERLLAHELSHVALHRAIHGNEVPRWFSEGVAILHSGEHSFARVRTLWGAALQGGLIPLTRLSSSFGARHGEVDLAYSQSADLVGFMLEGDDGPARLRALTRRLAAGDSFEAAFATAHGMSLGEFEQQWRVLIAQRFGRWPSILSGLTFVWAAAAVLLIVGYVRVRRRHRAALQRWASEEAAPSSVPPDVQLAVQPPPVPSPRTPADVVLDAWVEQQRSEGGIPTIVHEGRSYTLH